MDAITYSAARANLAQTMNRVCEDHAPVIITRNSEQSVVMLSLDDYNALAETAYLLRTPKNAQRLLAAVAQLQAGQGKPARLTERSWSLPTRLGRTASIGNGMTARCWNASTS